MSTLRDQREDLSKVKNKGGIYKWGEGGNLEKVIVHILEVINQTIDFCKVVYLNNTVYENIHLNIA